MRVHPAFRDRDDTVIVKRDGKEYDIRMKTEAGILAAEAMKSMGADDVAAIVKWLRPASNLFRKLNTSWNPAFTAPNFAMDVGAATLITASDHGFKRAARVLSLLPRSIALSWGVAGDRFKKPGNKWYSLAREYFEAGGANATYGRQDFQTVKSQIEDLMKDLNPSRLRRGTMPIRKVGEFLTRINEAAEMATRLATYIAAREDGVPADKAASISKNATINFGRRGKYGSTVNTLWMFSNAGIQGITNLLRSATQNGKRGYAINLSAVASGLAWAMLGPGLLGKDDNDRDKYDKFTEADRQGYLPLPGGVSVPMPHGFRNLFTLGRLIGEAATGRKTWTDATLSAFSNMASLFNPLGNAPTPLQAIAPTLLDPAVQIAENKDWRGRPIHPSGFDPNQPQSEQSFRQTPQWAKDVSRKLNTTSGGDAVTKGWLDFYPGDIAHLVDFMGGGAFRTLTRAYDAPGKIWSGDFKASDLPVVNRFLHQDTSNFEGNRFREYLRNVDKEWGRYLAYEKAGDQEKMATVQKESGRLLQMRPKAEEARARIKELRDQEDAAKLKGDTAAVREARAAQERLALEFNKQIEALPESEFQEDPRDKEKRVETAQAKAWRESLPKEVLNLLKEKNRLDAIGEAKLTKAEKARQRKLERIEMLYGRFMDWNKKGKTSVAEKYRQLLEKEAGLQPAKQNR